MAINKVVYNSTTLIDLSGDSLADASNLVSGQTAHDRTGTQITGTLVIQEYYTGSSTPSSSLGNNGDLYLKTS